MSEETQAAPIFRSLVGSTCNYSKSMLRLSATIWLCLFVVAPLSNANSGETKDKLICEIDAVQWGALQPEGEAEITISLGQKPVSDRIRVRGDGAGVSTAYVVFDLPTFKHPVLFGELHLQVNVASWTAPIDSVDLVLFDYGGGLELLFRNLWTLQEFLDVQGDLQTGRQYGQFSVQASDTAQVVVVPLTYDAIFDIYAASGSSLVFGIGGSIEFPGEGSRVTFDAPDEGGVVQLLVTSVGNKCP